jgi:hypothetical protein
MLPHAATRCHTLPHHATSCQHSCLLASAAALQHAAKVPLDHPAPPTPALTACHWTTLPLPHLHSPPAANACPCLRRDLLGLPRDLQWLSPHLQQLDGPAAPRASLAALLGASLALGRCSRRRVLELAEQVRGRCWALLLGTCAGPWCWALVHWQHVLLCAAVPRTLLRATAQQSATLTRVSCPPPSPGSAACSALALSSLALLPSYALLPAPCTAV